MAYLYWTCTEDYVHIFINILSHLNRLILTILIKLMPDLIVSQKLTEERRENTMTVAYSKHLSNEITFAVFVCPWQTESYMIIDYYHFLLLFSGISRGACNNWRCLGHIKHVSDDDDIHFFAIKEVK